MIRHFMFHRPLSLLHSNKNTSTIQSWALQRPWCSNPSHLSNFCANDYMKNISRWGKDPTALSERQNEANLGVLIGFRFLSKCKWREVLESKDRDKKLVLLGICKKENWNGHETHKRHSTSLVFIKIEPRTILFYTSKLAKFRSMTIPSNDESVEMWRCILHYW